MNWPANSKNRHLLTTEHAENLGFLLPCVRCVPWFHGFWVLTSVYSGVPVRLAVLVSCKVLTMVSARSTPAEVVQPVRRTSSPSAKSYSAYDGLPVRRPSRTARTTDFQSVGQGVQRVRRTSSPSTKSYSAYDGLPVRRTRRTGGSIGATDWNSVVQGDQNANSLLSLMQPPFCGCKHRIPTRTPSRSKSPKQARGQRREGTAKQPEDFGAILSRYPRITMHVA